MMLASLLTLALRAVVFACAAGLVLALLRTRRATVRLTGWTLVLYTVLAMPLLSSSLPGMAWSIPLVLPSSPRLPGVARAQVSTAFTATAPGPTGSRSPAPAPTRTDELTMTSPHPTASSWARPSWLAAASALYLTGVFFLLLRTGTGWLLTRRLGRSARPIDDANVLTRLDRCAAAVGLERAPRLLQADALMVPITIDILHPAILLPNSWPAWDSATFDAVLTHELAHIVRRDVLTQRLSLLYRAVFWFSPLGWWLRRKLADLAEDASDEAVLDAGAEREAYAETLLGFFAAMNTAPRRARWHAVAMARGGGSAQRRVDRILAWEPRPSVRLTPWLVAAMISVAAPIGLLAATVVPVGRTLSLPGTLMSPILVSPTTPRMAVHSLAEVALESSMPQQAATNHELSPVVAQVPTPVAPTPAQSFRVDGVSTIVFARGADGKTVAGLKPEEFRVFEDGVEQEIQVFSQFIGQLLMPGPPPPPPAKDARPRLFMILVDDLNTSDTEFGSLKSTLETIRDTVLRDDDLVGVTSTGYSSIQNDPQYDRGHVRLNQAIAKLVAAGSNPPRPSLLSDAERRERYARVALSTATDLLAQAAKVTDWQKILIYVRGPNVARVSDPAQSDRQSTQFVEADLIRAIADIIRAANSAGVTFLYGPQKGFPTAGADNIRYADWREYVEKTTTSIRTLAEETAGRAEPSAYYLIGYTSSNRDLSKTTRKIEIQTTRPGVQLDYRREYVIKY